MRHRRVRRRFSISLFALLAMAIIVFIDDRLQATSPRPSDILAHPAGNIFGTSLSLEGCLENARAKGVVNLFDEQVDFNGRVSLSGERLSLKDFYLRSIGLVITRGEVDFKTHDVYLKARLNHLYFKGLDIASDITLSGRYRLSGETGGRLSFEGEITAERLIINQRPFDDARMVFRLKDKVLDILRLDIGRISVSGKLDSGGPAKALDMVITADNLNLTQLLLNLKAQDITILSGVLNAKIALKGALAKPLIEGRLEIRNGNLGNIFFKSMSMNLSGIGTSLKIEDSRINTQNGHLAMIGDFDLANIGKRNIFAGVQVLTDNNNVFLDGWDIAKKGAHSFPSLSFGTIRRLSGSGKLEAVKNVSDTIDIGFKTYVEDEDARLPDPRDRDSSLELGYKMFNNEALKMRLGENSEFFGLEHREEF